MTVRDTGTVGRRRTCWTRTPDGDAATAGRREPVHPAPQGAGRRGAACGRNIWRQLTSMRTALILLFLLALASLPGALLPQWSLNSAKTAQYIIDHPTLGPLLDRLGFFEVFGIALVRGDLPAAVHLAGRLPAAAHPGVRRPAADAAGGHPAQPRPAAAPPHRRGRRHPDEVADRITAGLRGLADRPAHRAGGPGPTVGDVTISAEKGYLREVGNLVFHLSLLGLLVAIAVGKLVGYEGSVIVNVGSQFCSTSPASYDNFRPGLLVDGTDLAPFCVDVQKFTATYTDAGQASGFVAQVRAQSGADAGTDRWQISGPAGQRPAADGRRTAVPARPRVHPALPDHLPGRHRAGLLAAVRAGSRTTRTSPRRARSRFSTRPGRPATRSASSSWRSSGSSRRPRSLHGGIMTSSFPAAGQSGGRRRRLPR